MASAENGVLAVVAILAGLISAGLIVGLLPWLKAMRWRAPMRAPRTASRRPQGGGIAVIAATLAAAWLGVCLAGTAAPVHRRIPGAHDCSRSRWPRLGAIDDIRATRRLRCACAPVRCGRARDRGAARLNARIIPELPWWLERALLLLGGVWFVNLVNFMDGIDWMTVAEIVPVTGGDRAARLLWARAAPADAGRAWRCSAR